MPMEEVFDLYLQKERECIMLAYEAKRARSIHVETHEGCAGECCAEVEKQAAQAKADFMNAFAAFVRSVRA